MTDRLIKEIERIEDNYHGFESISRAEVIEIIEQFYNLALADVKAETERIKTKIISAQAPTETHRCYKGGRILGYDDVLTSIEKLTGE